MVLERFRIIQRLKEHANLKVEQNKNQFDKITIRLSEFDHLAGLEKYKYLKSRL
jgi:hypothetical protein